MQQLPFKKLIIWNKAMVIAKETYEITKKLPREEQFGLSSQMKRAAVSVASNIAEGNQRGTKRDFANFLSIAKGSLSELETQLLLTKDLYSKEVREIESIFVKIDELGKMLYSFRDKLISSN